MRESITAASSQRRSTVSQSEAVNSCVVETLHLGAKVTTRNSCWNDSLSFSQVPEPWNPFTEPGSLTHNTIVASMTQDSDKHTWIHLLFCSVSIFCCFCRSQIQFFTADVLSNQTGVRPVPLIVCVLRVRVPGCLVLCALARWRRFSLARRGLPRLLARRFCSLATGRTWNHDGAHALTPETCRLDIGGMD